MRIEVYDTTLRDGAQTEGVSFSVEDKLKIVKILDDFGVAFIEGGFPGSAEEEMLFFKQVKELELKNAKITAFGSTAHSKNLTNISADEGLQALLDADTEWVTIFGKSWKLHVDVSLKIPLDENLWLIEQSVRYLVEKGKKVIYDAEHFFDGYKDDPKYALATLKVATDGGASHVVLCDTNGGSCQDEIEDAVFFALKHFNATVTFGIHCHNDAALAVANSMTAVSMGVKQIQGTVNGLGERCGNADFCALIPNLQLKKGLRCVPDESLTKMTALSRFVSEIANVAQKKSQPYVGKQAFAHKGGVHVAAVKEYPRTYEHRDPREVGNERNILVSKQAGKSAVHQKIVTMFPQLGKKSPEVVKLVKKVKDAEAKGYMYEGAEASFRLLVLKELGVYSPAFDVTKFRTITEGYLSNGKCGEVRTEATIKVVEPNGQEEHTAADGDGPVNALDLGLRKALSKFFPGLKGIQLTDYKVRVLDTKDGTGAKVRVLIETSDGEVSWTTIGVSENIIQASMEALVDSFEYFLLIHTK